MAECDQFFSSSSSLLRAPIWGDSGSSSSCLLLLLLLWYVVVWHLRHLAASHTFFFHNGLIEVVQSNVLAVLSRTEESRHISWKKGGNHVSIEREEKEERAKQEWSQFRTWGNCRMKILGLRESFGQSINRGNLLELTGTANIQINFDHNSTASPGFFSVWSLLNVLSIWSLQATKK